MHHSPLLAAVLLSDLSAAWAVSKASDVTTDPVPENTTTIDQPSMFLRKKTASLGLKPNMSTSTSTITVSSTPIVLVTVDETSSTQHLLSFVQPTMDASGSISSSEWSSHLTNPYHITQISTNLEPTSTSEAFLPESTANFSTTTIGSDTSAARLESSPPSVTHDSSDFFGSSAVFESPLPTATLEESTIKSTETFTEVYGSATTLKLTQSTSPTLAGLTLTSVVTSTVEVTSTITPSPAVIETNEAEAKSSSLSAVSSHILEADEYLSGGLDTYLEAEWAFWHAQEAARTMRLLEDADSTLSVPITISSLAFSSMFSSLADADATTYVVLAGETRTITGGDAQATTTITQTPPCTSATTSVSSKTLETRAACDCAGGKERSAPSRIVTARESKMTMTSPSDNSASESSTMEWIQELPLPLRALFYDDDVNKLVILHRGDLSMEYNDGPSRITKRETLGRMPDTPLIIVRTSQEAPVYNDGKRVIIVDDGNIKVQINKGDKTGPGSSHPGAR